MEIDGLDEKPKPTIEELGQFKLKDKTGKNAIEIDLSKATRPLNEARFLYIAKVHGRNNCFKVSVYWKPGSKEKK